MVHLESIHELLLSVMSTHAAGVDKPGHAHNHTGADSAVAAAAAAAALEHSDVDVSFRLLVVCSIVVCTLAGMWGSYWALAKLGKEFYALRLSLLCLSFGACSWGMNVLNKALVEAFRAPSLVTAAQMLMTVFGTLVLASDKVKGDSVQVLKWSFVPFLFFGMLVSSFFSLEYLTLSVLVVIRNLAPLVTLPLEKMVMPADRQPLISMKMVVALFVILSGAFVYAGHVEVSGIGLFFALLNMVLAVGDRLAQRRLLTGECKNLSTEMCVLLNNLIGCVPTIALGAFVGELKTVDWKLWFQSEATLLLLLSGLIGSGICYFAIMVQRELSATSFMVLQNVARMAVVVAGVLLFHDPLDRHSFAGLILTVGGAIFYGRSQVEAATDAKNRAAQEAAIDPEKQRLLPPKSV